MFGGVARVESQEAINEARRTAAKERRKKKRPGVSKTGFRTEGMTALQLQMAEAELRDAAAHMEAPRLPPELVVLDELWEWSGGHWTYHNGAAKEGRAQGKAPRGRSHHAMVAIEKASKLLVGGGTTDVDCQVGGGGGGLLDLGSSLSLSPGPGAHRAPRPSPFSLSPSLSAGLDA